MLLRSAMPGRATFLPVLRRRRWRKRRARTAITSLLSITQTCRREFRYWSSYEPSMYAEAELIPISALQHFIVCPRQCALIHLESVWIEDARTAEGRVEHERVDRGGAETRGLVRRAYAVPLRSLRLGLTGKADVVEFHASSEDGAERPFPVEHKRGRPKIGDEDRVQLCAQGLCLEEMLGVPVPTGALFYGKSRRRINVSFSKELRHRTEEVAAQVRQLFDNGVTPP